MVKRILNTSLATTMLKKIRSLCIFLPKMNAYRRDFDESKYMYFFRKDDELLERYNETWEKVKNSIKKEFDSEPVYNEKHLKAKINSYNGKINTNFHNNKIPKEGSQLVCRSVILIDSVFRTDKNYYPQVFLEEFKCVVKGKTMPEYITDEIEISSDDSDGEDSDEKHSGEGNSKEEN